MLGICQPVIKELLPYLLETLLNQFAFYVKKSIFFNLCFKEDIQKIIT